MVNGAIDTSLYRDVQLSKIGVFTDPDGGPWIVTADFGDGTPLTHVDYRRPAGGATYEFTLAHAYDKTGTFTMTITVSDSLGATGSAAVHVLVRKIPVLFVPGIF